jgi:ATP-dependent RNA helicase DeaD
MSSVDRDLASQPVSRSQNAVLVLPHDWTSIAEFLAPLVERIDPDASDLQLLVATGDADAAAAVIAASARLIGERPIRVLAATSTARATRLARLRPPHIVSGTPTTLVDLVRASAIKLADLRAICIAWADELVARDESASLETLMAEVPKSAPRTIVASVVTPAVDELVERYARRARREVARVPESNEPIALEYVLVSPPARSATLRRLLDELDPASAVIFAREAESQAGVRGQLRALGYSDDGDVRCALATAPGTALTVLYDLPATHEELREAVAGAARRIAIVQPRQLDSLRALSLNGALKPHRLPEVAAASRTRDASVLAQLRATLESGTVSRELLSLEPLLEDYDGAEVAAAALKLLEQERLAERARAAAQERAAPSERAVHASREPSGPMVTLFASVGAREGLRPADLVGMITSKAGVAGSDVGRIDIRESHSTIEVASELADQIIDRASGTIVKGRRALLKRDERPARRDDRPPRREDRPPRREDRPPRREGFGGGRAGGGRRDGGGRDERPGRARGARDGFRTRDRNDDRPRRDRDAEDRPRGSPRGPRPTPRA